MRLSCLTDPSKPFIADASTIINLNASGCAGAVLRAIPNRCLILDTVLSELRADRRSGRDDARLVGKLIDAGLARVVTLSDLKESYFETLVSGPAFETLDDGEAATIACALEAGAIAIVDERKATSICARRYPELTTGSTVDLFAHDAVLKVLGRPKLAEGVLSALKDARMRVLPRHEEWVVSLIGTESAAQCLSLSARLRAACQNKAAT